MFNMYYIVLVVPTRSQPPHTFSRPTALSRVLLAHMMQTRLVQGQKMTAETEAETEDSFAQLMTLEL